MWVDGGTDWCKTDRDGADSQKRAILKCQLQLRKKVISLRLSNDRKLSFLSEKG